jgi:hypothetical protein
MISISLIFAAACVHAHSNTSAIAFFDTQTSESKQKMLEKQLDGNTFIKMWEKSTDKATLFQQNADMAIAIQAAYDNSFDYFLPVVGGVCVLVALIFVVGWYITKTEKIDISKKKFNTNNSLKTDNNLKTDNSLKTGTKEIDDFVTNSHKIE